MGGGNSRGFVVTVDNNTDSKLTGKIEKPKEIVQEHDCGQLIDYTANVDAKSPRVRLLVGRGKKGAFYGVHVRQIVYKIEQTKFELHLEICASYFTRNTFFVAEIIDSETRKCAGVCVYGEQNAKRYRKSHGLDRTALSKDDNANSPFIVTIDATEGMVPGGRYWWNITLKLENNNDQRHRRI